MEDFKAKMSKCGCGNPLLERFGNMTLCMRDNCLTSWVIHQSHKLVTSRILIKILIKRSNDSWLDYIQHFRLYCCEKQARGQMVISHFDVKDSLRTYLTRQGIREYADSEVTQPEIDYDSDDDVESHVNKSSNELVSTDNPLISCQLAQYRRMAHKEDPKFGDLNFLTVADALKVEDDALLSGRSVTGVRNIVYRTRETIRGRK